MTERALASIETNLDREIRLKGAVIHEELGRQFHIDATIQASSPIDPDQLLGLPVIVRLHGEQGERVFHGYCVRIELLAPGVGGIGYRLTIRSILWFLTRTTDSRIFQNDSVIDILKTILEKYDFEDIELKLQKEYEPLPYCVQYQETDHAFFHRLLERHGIYYYFVHSDSGHRIVLCDDPASHDFLERRKEIEYYMNPSTATQIPQILEWNGEYSYRTSTVAVADYDFRKPRTRLQTRDSREDDNALAEHEFFRYPGGFEDVEKGEDVARRLLEIEQEDRAVFHARSNVMELTPGFLFELKAQDPLLSKAFDGSYLITQITHHVVVGDPESGDAADDSYYENSVRVIPSETPFRLDLNTPAPRITGPQTAIVVGPEGEEIYTDEYGRIKVQFHWDRYGKRDENSSCWIRVAQMWAGKRWGAVHLPRVGQEVIVEFLDGDPDRPIVTGRVYNGEQMPPYALPDQKNKSGVKSHTVQGSASSYNEILFDDTKGAELFSMRAQKDMNVTVNNDYQLRVVKGKYRIDVADKNVIAVHEDDGKGDQAEGISIESKTGSINSIAKNELLFGALDGEARFGSENANTSIWAKNGILINDEDGGIEITSINSDINTSSTSMYIKSVSECFVKSAQITIDATAKIVLKCGPSTIELTPAAVNIVGPLVKIN